MDPVVIVTEGATLVRNALTALVAIEARWHEMADPQQAHATALTDVVKAIATHTESIESRLSDIEATVKVMGTPAQPARVAVPSTPNTPPATSTQPAGDAVQAAAPSPAVVVAPSNEGSADPSKPVMEPPAEPAKIAVRITPPAGS